MKHVKKIGTKIFQRQKIAQKFKIIEFKKKFCLNWINRFGLLKMETTFTLLTQKKSMMENLKFV